MVYDNDPIKKIIFDSINESIENKNCKKNLLGIEVYEGINISNDSLDVDWEEDKEGDIIYLSNWEISELPFGNDTRFYGYKINKSRENKLMRDELIKYIKGDNGCNDEKVYGLIDRMIEDFFVQSKVKRFDYLIKLPSNSRINTLIANTIEDDYNPSCKEIRSWKEPVENIEINYDKLNNCSEKNRPIIISYLKSALDKMKQEGKFSIKRINKDYRKYLKNFISVDNASIEDMNSSLLIIDDMMSTGASISEVVYKLRSKGFTGSIYILTLLNNK